MKDGVPVGGWNYVLADAYATDLGIYIDLDGT